MLSLAMTYYHPHPGTVPHHAASNSNRSQNANRGLSSVPAVPALSALSSKAPEHVTPSDFVQYPNRVNVAISRARYALVVVSSTSVTTSMKNVTNRTVWGPLLGAQWQLGGATQPMFLVTRATAPEVRHIGIFLVSLVLFAPWRVVWVLAYWDCLSWLALYGFPCAVL